MFRHNLVNIPEIECYNDPEYGRIYLTPEGNKYPSVSTVLSVMDKSGLERWATSIGIVKAERIKNSAAIRGESFHLLCENFVNNKPLQPCMPDAMAMFNSVKHLLSKHVNDVYGQEVPLWSDFLRVGGRVDLAARWDTRRTIIDYKTASRQKKPEWLMGYKMQTAAYSVMFEERTKIPIQNNVIVIAVQGDQPQIIKTIRDDWIGEFIKLRQIYKERFGI